MKGYDRELVRTIREAISLPITVLGGAGLLKDIGQLISEYRIIGAAPGAYLYSKMFIRRCS